MSIYLICVYMLIGVFLIVIGTFFSILLKNKSKYKKNMESNLKQKKASLYIKYDLKSKELLINNYVYLNIDICKSVVDISKKEGFEDKIKFLIKNQNEKIAFNVEKDEFMFFINFSFREKIDDVVVLRCEYDVEKVSKPISLYTIEELKEIHEKSKNKKSVLYHLNIKDFNTINQRYSQTCGDYILEHIKERLSKFDKKHLYCSYLNSDQFIIYYNKNINKKKALKFIKNVNKKLCKQIDVGYVSVDIVFGVGMCIANYDTLDEFFKSAYIASDYAKKRKNYNVVIFNEKMKIEENTVISCENVLEDILDTKEINIKYNPVFNHKKSKFVGYISDIEFDDKQIDYNKLKNIAIQKDRIDSLMNVVIDNLLRNYLKRRPNKNSKLFINLKLEDLSTFLEIYFSNNAYSDCKIVICLDIRRGYEMINKFSNISSCISKIVEEGIEIASIINYSNMYEYDYILKNSNYLVLDDSVINNLNNNVLVKNKLINIVELAENYDLDLFAIDVREYIQFEGLIKYNVEYLSGPYFGKGASKPSEIEQVKTRIFAKFLKDAKKSKNN